MWPGTKEAGIVWRGGSQADVHHGSQHPGQGHRQPPAGPAGGGAGVAGRAAARLLRHHLQADDWVQA